LCIRSGLLGMNLFEITKFMGRQTL
jgi:hypothetical protein